MTTVLFLVSGIAYMLWGPLLLEGKHGWQTSGDLWGIFRAAHYIGWGYVGGVYDPSTGVNSLPGMEVLLAPVAMLSGHLGLTESFPPYFLPHPTAALLLQPIELLIGASVLFAIDALSEQLGVGKGRRFALCLIVAILAWPTVAIWGHAEDCLALTLAIYALIFGMRGNWKSCGWLFGFALVTQPLVVMLLPLVVGSSPKGQRLALAFRSVALAAVLGGLALASNAADALRALVQQPTPPAVNQPTPWVSLAPTVGRPLVEGTASAGLTVRSGRFAQLPVHPPYHQVVLVSGGAGRAVEMVVAVVLGIYVWRRPQPCDRFVWLAAVALGMRCMFEAVMLPYYLGPPLILAVAIASRCSRTRFWAASMVSIATTVFAFHHFSPWVWWLPVVFGVAIVLALGYPGRTGPGPSASPSPSSGRADCDPYPERTSLDRESSAEADLAPVG